MEDKGRHSDFRFERKFLSRNLDHNQLQHLVLNHPSCFHEIFHARKVNNIYFDTPDLKFFEDNVSGKTDRLKVRIRWYGQKEGMIENPVLEFKIKEGLVGRKSSYNLTDFTLPDYPTANFFRDLFGKSGLPDPVIESLKGLEPVLINNYVRRYFLSFDRKFRFTVDKDLNYMDYRSYRLGRMVKYTDHSASVLELKYDRNLDNLAGDIISHLPIRITKSSKYVSGLYFIRPDLAL